MNKNREKESIFRITARFIKYNVKLVFAVVFFTGLISLAVFGNKGLLQRIQLESEKKDLEKMLEAEVKKTDELKKEIEELKNSDKKIEEIAREKYGMTKEGEKIYKVIIDSTK